MKLYSLKRHNGYFAITKFDEDLEVESSYRVTEKDCDCPAGSNGKYCRHRIMLPAMAHRADTSWFYDYKFKVWYRFDFENSKLITESPIKPRWRRI